MTGHLFLAAQHNGTQRARTSIGEMRAGAAKRVVCAVVLLCCCLTGTTEDILFFAVPLNLTSGTANEEERVQITQDSQTVEFKSPTRLVTIMAENTNTKQWIGVRVKNSKSRSTCHGGTCASHSWFPPGSSLLHATSHHTAQQVFDLCCV